MNLRTAGFFIVLSGFLFDATLGNQDLDDSSLSTMQLIKKYGYPGESHLVETEDGYMIQMHRIPHGKNSNSSTPGKPFFLLHGMLSSSEQFLMLGADSLAFFAADRGYDVWMGNMRGNFYGKLHRNLGLQSPLFWDFSWHEHGLYDITAQIDYICNYTQKEKVLLLGYSLGTSSQFAMLSVRKNYQKKVQGALMMAPVATFHHGRAFSRAVYPYVQILLKLITKGEIFQEIPLRQILLNYWCFSSPVSTRICKEIFLLFVGIYPDGITEEVLQKVIFQCPSSTSAKTFLHYLQVAKSGKFQQYDYGPIENAIKYGSPEPPEYDLESITVPRLPNIRSVEVADLLGYNHIDFVVRKENKEKVYDSILNMVDDLSEETK